MKDIKEFYEKHRFLICFLAIIIPVAVLFLGCVFCKPFFWDNFIWKYYWGSVVSDAENRTINGIGPGYNIVNTLTYGVILAISLFLIYRLLRKVNITPDCRFFISLSPFIMLGSVLRVMEDAGFFGKPFVYLFISPLIYVFLGLIVILILLLGDVAEKRLEKKIRNKTLLFSGIISLSVCIGLLSSRGLQRLDAVLLILAITSLLTASVFSAFRMLKAAYPKLGVYLLGSNILLFFAHFLDASSTFVGTDFYNYAEKHPLPAFLINLSGSGAVMYPLKFVLVFLIVHILDITYKKELKDKTLTGIVKVCVFILGLAPGIRDMLRIGIGV